MAKRRREFSLDLRPLFLLAILVTLAFVAVKMNSLYEGETVTKIVNSLSIDDGDKKINWGRYPTEEIELREGIKITKGGTYRLSGDLEDGGIFVDAKNTVVKIVLDNARIKNPKGPAIYCEAAEDLVIEVVGDNYIEDGYEYSKEYNEEVSGAIYSRSDLTFVGEGTLEVKANFEDGIVSKDDLKFISGNYDVKSSDDGIRGTDSVYVTGGNFKIVAKNSGIKTTNDYDRQKGFVLVENGTFDINTLERGIFAANAVVIRDGNFKLKTVEDAIYAEKRTGIEGGNFEINKK